MRQWSKGCPCTWGTLSPEGMPFLEYFLFSKSTYLKPVTHTRKLRRLMWARGVVRDGQDHPLRANFLSLSVSWRCRLCRSDRRKLYPFFSVGGVGLVSSSYLSVCLKCFVSALKGLCFISGPRPQQMCAETKPSIRRPIFTEFCRGVHESQVNLSF